MRLEQFTVQNYRSIEEVKIFFPKDKPVIVFGPNNVGKSNILKAMELLLGERHPAYMDFQDSDYFFRDKKEFPNICLSAIFDEEFYRGRRNDSAKKICFSTNFEVEEKVENTFHFEGGAKMYLSNEQRSKCHFVLVDATRDIGRQLSYFNQYSILSKMAKRMHQALSEETKKELDENFRDVKNIFESVPEYKEFYQNLQSAFESNTDGFDHKLSIDLSAYDPNNYFKSLRIIAEDDTGVRSFDEFGTGEQQVLLMAFVKAYAETFTGQNFILGIEEPEAHLHPLAQRWLSKNVSDIAKSGVQIIITTHSPEFLDIENLEGFTKAYKEENVTKVIQHNAETFAGKCVELGANAAQTTKDTILPFYKVNTFYDQLKGFFARKIILVEGPTEVFSLPNYFANHGIDLIKSGVEIIDCRGKTQIARNYRLFTSYGYECFCLFDADEGEDGNEELAKIFEFDSSSMSTDPSVFTVDRDKKYGYFGVDFENYMRSNLNEYAGKEDEIQGRKVLKAKVVSENNPAFKPEFILDLAESIGIAPKAIEEANLVPENPVEDDPLDWPGEGINVDDIPF